MNAPGAHYVANADAKVQLFSVTAITFMHFFAKRALQRRKNRVIYKQLRTKSPQTTIFSLFLCNFAVACDCAATEQLHTIFKQGNTRFICRIFVTSQSLRT